MKKEIRNIISFWDLSKDWQEEAKSNLEEQAEEALYLEPEKNQNPKKHILYDLTYCFRVSGEEYNTVIPISNNSAMALNISPSDEQAEIWYL